MLAFELFLLNGWYLHDSSENHCLMPAGLEDLRGKRADIDVLIQGEEEEKTRIQNDLHILTERLARYDRVCRIRGRNMRSCLSFLTARRMGCGSTS